MRRWRGLKALIHDAVDRTTELVEEGHESTWRTVMAVLGAIEPLAEPARLVDRVYGRPSASVRQPAPARACAAGPMKA